jgi:putative transposase
MRKSKFTETQIVAIYLKRLKDMEQELSQFKRIVADLTLQNRILKDVIKKQ